MNEFIQLYRPIIQESKEFQEIVNHFYGHFSSLIHPQLTIADNIMSIPLNNINGSNNIVSAYCTQVGFKIYICETCLTGPIDPV
jgi:hypothetical protein